MPYPLCLADLRVPPSLIAQHPLSQRDDSRLMLSSRQGTEIGHHRFNELPGLLPRAALLVLNNSRVIPARLTGRLPGGRAIEVLLVDELASGRWSAMVKGARHIKPGMRLNFAQGALAAEALTRHADGRWELAFDDPHTMRQRLEVHGLAPLPPYIRRENGDSGAGDRAAYQTCYARHDGAIAAPTAGLHFTPRVFDALGARGIEWVELTLHVGAGTFRPIQVEDPEDHVMHGERYRIGAETRRRIAAARDASRPVIAVGTTTVRALESWAAAGFPEETDGVAELFIRPPHAFLAVDGLITNFHQPASTLLLLVAALLGAERTRAAYDEAIARGYRFFSYGDCMAILPSS